jgi:EpsI family protein
MSFRIGVLAICFVLAAAFLGQVSKSEPILIRESLAGLPSRIGGWERSQDLPFESRIENILGVDDYINRIYTANNSWISLYIGFYRSQRQGSTIHSPLNCLPGAGWNPTDRTDLLISVQGLPGQASRTIQVNRLVIEKGLDRQMVLYWYQAHGRVVASEYWGKIYTVLDAMRMNRTDAAMVRVISPISGRDLQAETASEHTAVQFVQGVFPSLSRHLPD